MMTADILDYADRIELNILNDVLEKFTLDRLSPFGGDNLRKVKFRDPEYNHSKANYSIIVLTKYDDLFTLDNLDVIKYALRPINKDAYRLEIIQDTKDGSPTVLFTLGRLK